MAEAKEQTLIEHLEELRAVLIKCLLALACGLVPIFCLRHMLWMH